MFRYLYFLSGITLLFFGLLPEAEAQNIQDSTSTAFRLPVVCTLPKEVDETSGLIFWRGSLWTHNDSGGLPVIYRIDTLTGKVLQRVKLRNATNKDWEDITEDSSFIYVGDMGNNSGNRHDLCIYKVKKSDIPLTGNVSIASEKIAFSYPDYKGPVKNRKHNNFDGEALLSAGDSLYLFSKDWQDQQSRLYALPKISGTYVARLISEYNVSGLVTGADYNPGTGIVALVGYTRGNWIPFMMLLTKFKNHNFFSGNISRINMPNARAPQTEGIAFTKGNRVYFSSEGRNPIFKQTLYAFSIEESWLEKKAAVTSRESVFDINISPRKLKKKENTLYLTGFPQQAFDLQILGKNNRKIKEYHFTIKYITGKTRLRVTLPSLKCGSYMLQITANGTSSRHRFIKK